MTTPLKKWLFLTEANQQILDKNLLYGKNYSVAGSVSTVIFPSYWCVHVMCEHVFVCEMLRVCANSIIMLT